MNFKNTHIYEIKLNFVMCVHVATIVQKSDQKSKESMIILLKAKNDLASYPFCSKIFCNSKIIDFI